ncbi:pre-mRNA-splicing factor 38A [Neodiprion pinetum]|uniref:Pre-mRNA-splicing factor 38 n=1 Tax=Neodiprion lecontei TaxID=441921 RepID=A0A6J0CDZ2_NEOLC|nr:pre-mRNA-splicing factor 38A [Neodiprion lecontei]XP_046431518.1 pre-mRNA-splicing factor 38A [Neodiprion fabricii]XP_046482270.1 pre-mRNA-splicing factor 38A [Neodiprion pinetum]XP_046630347.1 pre-mRNA-splicing factor 38A [Neodiprion virginianus]
MANRTVKDAKSIRGTNPQYLVEKIIRSRIYDSKYWKEECFALTAELLVDKAMELKYIGGVFGGNVKPTPFLCLILKMLQIQPEKDIIVEFIKNEEFKYVRALGALYMRLTGTSVDCYKYLEPLFNDNRKLRRQNKQGQYELIHMDEFIDELLREERSCDVILPRIQKRHVLEENNEIEGKISALEDDMDEGIESSDDEDVPVVKEEVRKRTEDFERERHRDREKRHARPEKKVEREKRRSRSRERERDRRERKRSKSPKLYSSSSHKDKDRDKDRHRRDDREKERDRDRRRERERPRH